MKSKIRKALFVGGITLACLVGKAVYEENFSEEIKNIDDFVRVIKEEEQLARKYTLTKTIYWTEGKTPWGTAASGKLSEGKYIVIFDKKRNRTVVRHELYHIYAGHCDRAFAKGEWTITDKIKDEITANVYAWYGLRF